MSRSRPSVAGPVLFWGIASGMVASLMCCFWPGVVGGAFFGVRGVRRDHDLTPGSAALLGAGTGLVAGCLVATLGTAVLLSNAGPEEMQAMQELGLQAEIPGLGAIAFGHALLGLVVATIFGLIGGAVAGGGPSERARRQTSAAGTSTVAPVPFEPSGVESASAVAASPEPSTAPEEANPSQGLEEVTLSDVGASDGSEPPKPPEEGGFEDLYEDEAT